MHRHFWGDEHSYDMHSLLEENALLRRILVKMDLVLKKVVDPKERRISLRQNRYDLRGRAGREMTSLGGRLYGACNAS